ncbi:hypothetical protein PISMIDRAFT_624490 [Pisolithus microcarpus 441]|uniref:Uncharacterized protein n=1 Tax=Pisolithus microcarpus 441 TaxID=765257 RepID=A0A0C9Y448_9AGAM|nr:hypothetical protein PISMIDRAFT_624490 [Pisolithus microcarpus 441]
MTIMIRDCLASMDFEHVNQSIIDSRVALTTPTHTLSLINAIFILQDSHRLSHQFSICNTTYTRPQIGLYSQGTSRKLTGSKSGPPCDRQL